MLLKKQKSISITTKQKLLRLTLKNNKKQKESILNKKCRLGCTYLTGHVISDKFVNPKKEVVRGRILWGIGAGGQWCGDQRSI
jgi:hypothetical protein